MSITKVCDHERDIWCMQCDNCHNDIADSQDLFEQMLDNGDLQQSNINKQTVRGTIK